MPPETSLPIETPPWPSFIWQSRMMMFSLGTLMRRPSALRPDLIAMQSSPVLNTQLLISTSVAGFRIAAVVVRAMAIDVSRRAR